MDAAGREEGLQGGASAWESLSQQPVNGFHLERKALQALEREGHPLFSDWGQGGPDALYRSTTTTRVLPNADVDARHLNPMQQQRRCRLVSRRPVTDVNPPQAPAPATKGSHFAAQPAAVTSSRADTDPRVSSAVHDAHELDCAQSHSFAGKAVASACSGGRRGRLSC